jgi:hypothetical protein
MRNRWVTISLLACLLGLGQCRKSARAVNLMPTAELACQALTTALQQKDSRRIFQLLDTDSHWSIMSILKDQQTMCALVIQHYPKERQAMELQRCRLATTTKEPQDFFPALAEQHHLLQRLTEANPNTPHQDGQVEIACLGHQLSFCKEMVTRQDSGFWYCGLGAILEDLKIKTSRDLLTVQENTEIYKKH